MESIVTSLLNAEKRPAHDAEKVKQKCLVFWTGESRTSIIDLEAVICPEDRVVGKSTKCRWTRGKFYEATIIEISDSDSFLEEKQKAVTEEVFRQLSSDTNETSSTESTGTESMKGKSKSKAGVAETSCMKSSGSESTKRKSGKICTTTTVMAPVCDSATLCTESSLISETGTTANVPKKSKKSLKENMGADGEVPASKKKRLQSESILSELNKLIEDINDKEKSKEELPIDLEASTSELLRAANDVLFSDIARQQPTESNPCCSHCVNLHVRLNHLEEEVKNLKRHTQPNTTEPNYNYYMQPSQYQDYTYQTYIHHPQPHLQQQQDVQQPQQQQDVQQPQKHEIQQPQQEQQQDEELYNGFLKVQLIGKVQHLGFSKACKVLCRMMFSEEEREGRCVVGTGKGGKQPLPRGKLEKLYEIITHLYPGPQSCPQAINIKLAEVLKPSARTPLKK